MTFHITLIILDRGSLTCAGYEGSLGFEVEDAQQYANWEVDALKYDNCYNDASVSIQDSYQIMSTALNDTGRAMIFAICEWGVQNPWEWAGAMGQSWRTTDDIFPTWSDIIRVADNSLYLSPYAGPHQWNDLDMIMAGVQYKGLTLNLDMASSQFFVWSIFKSPLMISLTPEEFTFNVTSLLLSSPIIALNQDSLGVPGDIVFQRGADMIFASPLADGSRGVVMWDRHTHSQWPPGQPVIYPDGYNMTLNFAYIGFTNQTTCSITNLFTGEDLGTFTGTFTTLVPHYGALGLQVTPTSSSDMDVSWRPWFNSPFYDTSTTCSCQSVSNPDNDDGNPETKGSDDDSVEGWEQGVIIGSSVLGLAIFILASLIIVSFWKNFSRRGTLNSFSMSESGSISSSQQTNSLMEDGFSNGRYTNVYPNSNSSSSLSSSNLGSGSRGSMRRPHTNEGFSPPLPTHTEEGEDFTSQSLSEALISTPQDEEEKVVIDFDASK